MGGCVWIWLRLLNLTYVLKTVIMGVMTQWPLWFGAVRARWGGVWPANKCARILGMDVNKTSLTFRVIIRVTEQLAGTFLNSFRGSLWLLWVINSSKSWIFLKLMLMPSTYSVYTWITPLGVNIRPKESFWPKWPLKKVFFPNIALKTVISQSHSLTVSKISSIATNRDLETWIPMGRSWDIAPWVILIWGDFPRNLKVHFWKMGAPGGSRDWELRFPRE